MALDTLDERYLYWLHDQVAPLKNGPRSRKHRSLMQQLHETVFVALVAHDENRIADAKDLRHEFLAEHPEEVGDPRWMRWPATMMELLIILARQLAFEMDDDPRNWFWHLLEVLDLEQFNDREYDEAAREEIAHILDRVNWRQYEADGHGGLFPLRNPSRDQRQVELWYQLNAYLREQF